MRSGEDDSSSPKETSFQAENGGWSCKRIEITHQEARAVLEAQQTTLADIDEKAMRTVRTTVILIGVIVSIAKVTEIDLHTGLATVGSVVLFGSLAFGLATYDETDLYIGPNQEYLEQLSANEFRKTWEQDLIETYGYWIAKNGDDMDFNGFLLRVSQALLFCGLLFISLSLAL